MVGILILNYNNYQDTVNCIASIERYNTFPSKILVVDNGSTRVSERDKVDKYLKEKFKDSFSIYKENQTRGVSTLSPVSSLHLLKNYGYAVGNNKGLELFYKDDDIDNVLLINNDIILVEDMVPKLVKKISSKGKAVISPVLYKIGLKEIDWDCCRKEPSLGDVFIQHLFLCRNIFGIQSNLKKKNSVANLNDVYSGNTVQVDMPSGSCMLFNKNVFIEIDSFDPNTFLYYEENILSQKFKRHNVNVFVDFSTKCIHVGASTVKKTVNSVFSTKCWIRSCKYYLKKYRHPSFIYMALMDLFFNALIFKARIATGLRLRHLYK